MSVKKPAIPIPGQAGFDPAVKECIERMMGRRGGKVALLSALTSLSSPAASSGTLATDYLALRADISALLVMVGSLHTTINALLAQLEDV
jgi:hypothetical protein